MPFSIPFTGKMIYPSANACWRYQQDQMLEIMRGWCDYELRDLHDDENELKFAVLLLMLCVRELWESFSLSP